LSPSTDESEIQISEEKLQRVGIVVFILAVVFTIIGGFASPYDENGKPILLFPEVKAFEDYRRSARGWLAELDQLDSEISSLMSGEGQGDLFTQSRQAQLMLQHAVGITQEIDQVKPPAAALGIQEQVYSASMGYLEVARLTMQWVSVPEKAKMDEIQIKIGQVRELRETLERNPWLNKP